MTKEDAFDQVTSTPGIEVVLHTASPFNYTWTDAIRDVVDPAVKGTTGILKAIKRNAPQVRRVVVTSSFAAIVDSKTQSDPNVTLSEKTWNSITTADIHNSRADTYRASKKLAEKAAWDFVANEKPNFDLVTVNPPFVFGPVVHHLATVDTINASNDRLVKLLRGEWKNEVPAIGPVDIWVDVRDVATAHVLAFEKPELGGKRLFATAGRFNHQRIVAAVRDNFPQFKDKLPSPETKGGENLKDVFNFNNDETNKLLGIKWIPLEKCIVDFTNAVKDMGL